MNSVKRLLFFIALAASTKHLHAQTLTTLEAAFLSHPETLNSFCVLVWDNSPTAIATGSLQPT